MFDDKRQSLVWTIAGGYLLYLGDELLTLWYKGEAGYDTLSLIAGGVFVAVGGGLLFMAWRKWHSQEKNSEEKEQEKDV